MTYYIPKKLLTTENAKTKKGEARAYTTYIMYLAPAKQNDFKVNLCTHASKGCEQACLFNSGSARFSPVQLGKINKSNYLIANQEKFMSQLYNQIDSIVRLHNKVKGNKQVGKTGKVIRYKKFAIRLNGSSDILWERIKVKDNKNIFELFPDVQFYDYTKVDRRLLMKQPKNYHLTFSMHEENKDEAFKLLKNGFNVAIVFGVTKKQELPKEYLGYEIVDGDKDDLRFLDGKNKIVGLRYKNVVSKGNSHVNKKKFDTGFVIDVSNIK